MRYIGARYVPVFYENSQDQSTLWEPNVKYEPLTYVTDTNNHLYLSKKLVPDYITNPALNMEYWLDVTSFQGDIDVLQGEIDDINTDLSGIHDDITDINSRMKKKYIFFGDSYGFGFLPGGDEQTPDTTGFYKLAAQKIGLAASDYTEVCYGRAGFAATGVNNKTWVQDLQDLADDESVTDIYVMGGLNDIAYVLNNVLAQAMGTFFTLAKSKFPNAKIRVGFIGRESVNNVFNYSYLLQTINQYKTGALESGCAYIPGSENVLKGIQGGMASDSYHPSPLGQQMLSWFLINDLIGTQPFVCDVPWQGIAFTFDGDITSGIQIGFSQTAENIIIGAAGLSSMVCNWTPGVSLGNTEVKLGTLNSDAICGNPNNTALGNVNVLITGTGSKNYLCAGQMVIKNKSVYLQLTAIENGANINPGTVTGIYMLPYSVIIPKNLLC